MPCLDYQRLYEYRFRAVDQRARDEVWIPIAAAIDEQLGRPQRVLDPAAGRCEFINSTSAPTRWAVDQTDFAADRIDPGVEHLVGDVMTVDLPHEFFDGVLVSNFLEHLPGPEAIADFLVRMRSVMVDGGRIAVLGPNYRYCAREYWDCADHVVALTHVAVEEFVYAAGFEIVSSVPRFLPYSFRSRLPASRRLTTQYLKHPSLWRIFGKQFLVVARR